MKAILESQSLILIEPRRWAAQLARMADFKPEARAYKNDAGEECDCYGDPLPRMTIDADGIATIPVHGVISTGLPSIAAAYGFVDTGRIRSDIEAALADDRVKAILFDFDTPGGFVTGTPELAKFIEEAGESKRTYSFLRMCCSAGAWLAAPTRAQFVTTSSEVGSIGVYVATQDLSGLAKAMGIVVNVFRSGKFKGAGVPGTSLSDDQAANIQQRVDSLAALFKGHVLQHRPGVAEETMQGQTFMGYEAARVSLADAMVSDLAAAKKMLLADLT